MGITTQASVPHVDAAKSPQFFITPGFRTGFALIASLFFLWAIANNFNDILIRQFQKSLGLDRAQAGLIQFVFYIGYFTVALPAGLVLRRYGYKTGIIIGLLLYAFGAALFVPAAFTRTFGTFLLALFVIASGAAFLETAANPYVIAFGDPRRASERLNLAQAFNGLGAVLAPVIGGMLIFSGVEHSPQAIAAMSAPVLEAYRISEAQTVLVPYIGLAVMALVVAVCVLLVRLPKIASPGIDGSLAAQFRQLSKQRTLVGATIAQFFYVGAQVGIWSFFVDFVKDAAPGTRERQAAYLLSASLVLFMLGRFIGTALLTRVRPVALLGVYAVANILLVAAVVLTSGWMAIGALILTSFFMSIMFPTIFSLGLTSLGSLVPLGSSCLIMAIIGGAVAPPLMGKIAVMNGSLHQAMLVPMTCFVVIACYAWSGGAKRNQTMIIDGSDIGVR